MKHSTTSNLIAVILWTGVVFCSCICISAQPKLKEQNRAKNFGKSLKKYKKKEKNSSPDGSKAADEEETIQVQTNLVINDILVADKKGNIIQGLKQEDFIVTEDDARQEIGLFTFGENAKLPRSIVLIFDYSTSLLPYINNSTQAAKALVDKLGPNDRMAIVTDDVELAVDFTRDKTALKKKLDNLSRNTLSIEDGGKSRQYSALLSVLNEMFSDEDVRPIVILQSDGDEIFSLKKGAGEYPMSARMSAIAKRRSDRAFSYKDLLAGVENSRATIYSVIPGIRLLGISEPDLTNRVATMIRDSARPIYRKDVPQVMINSLLPLTKDGYIAGQHSMFEIAELSGGYTNYIEKTEDAELVYSKMLEVINNRYLIGYYPTNEIRDGKRRYVKIEVKDHPEYTIIGRKSYTFQPENR